MSSRRSRRLVRSTSLREPSGSSIARTPASASSGSVSSKIRPFERASVITVMRTRDNRGFYRKDRGKPCISMTSGHAPSGHPSDPRAELRQLLLDALVAAVEVVDAVDARLAFGNEARDDEARRGAQVRRHDVRALQPGHTVDHGGVAGDLDIGTQPL